MPKDFDVLFIPGGVGCIRNLENSSARDEILEAIFDFR
jgi:putative intracellular protease/amidase